MTDLRVVIVDDEELARSLIREYLQSHPDCEIVAECSNGLEAVKVIQDTDPDLIFLDIQMPKLNGFEVLELLDKPCGVVFTTAYDQYALKAFDIHAMDYLLKPFSQERFDEALARARQMMPALWSDLPNTYRRQRPEGFDDRIVVKDGSLVHVIPADSIDYIEAQDDYIAIHCGSQSYLKKQTLSQVEERLDPAKFIRIHRSFILRLDRLSRIELYAKDSRMAILRNGKQIPISRSGYERLKILL